jgi:hypothetical protein
VVSSFRIFKSFRKTAEDRNAMFRKGDLFPSAGEEGEDTYSVWSLRKSLQEANTAAIAVITTDI